MAKFSKIIRESNEKRLIVKFIKIFKIKLSKKIKESGRFTFVLTGGKSPIRLYKALNKTKNIEWKSVDFFIGDERYVKENSRYSNIHLCKKYLLNNLKIQSKQIFKITTNNKSIKKDTKNYQNKIKKYFLNKKISFDLILLGIGIDGHIASLFKNNIDKKNKNLVDYTEKDDFKRITLTLNCINDSNSIFLWAPGKRKSKIVKKILFDKNLKYPASYLKKDNNFLFHSN
jgi:6-phosphogluconolactonase